MNKNIARPVDLTAIEAETLGRLMDIITEHINHYELTAQEIKDLNAADEILFRLYKSGKGE